jgi:hypothetical protein
VNTSKFVIIAETLVLSFEIILMRLYPSEIKEINEIVTKIHPTSTIEKK